jgi:hypothetical protein
MELLINLLIALAMAAVLASLGLGLFSLARGGEYNRLNGNKFMRWRIKTQFVAIVLLVIGFAYKMARH